MKNLNRHISSRIVDESELIADAINDGDIIWNVTVELGSYDVHVLASSQTDAEDVAQEMHFHRDSYYDPEIDFYARKSISEITDDDLYKIRGMEEIGVSWGDPFDAGDFVAALEYINENATPDPDPNQSEMEW